MRYQKTIKYLEYLENGVKLRTAGFVKIELIDAVCHIYLQVSGFPMLDNLSREVFLEAREKISFLESLHFRQGKAKLGLRSQDARSLGREGLSYEELTAIRIPIGKNKELICRLRQVSNLEASVSKGTELDASAPKETEREEGLLEAGLDAPVSKGTEREEGLPEAGLEAPASKGTEREEGLPEAGLDASASEVTTAEISAADVLGAPPHFHEDKWQQLSSIYPHIKPFRDHREYLSIGLADFVVLQKQYHGLIANSFLLHGFYNYGHLILTRIERLGQIRYYLGVPGNFYEKEKQVAILFGFESFECKNEPVQTGDFGYYCVRVDI